MKAIKNIARNATLAVALSAGTCLCAQDAVSVVERPVTSVSNNYTNFRQPLQQVPLLKLPVGKVQPKGWLRKYLELQKDGLNGQLGTISAWLDKNNNQWLSDSGDHGWEEVPYWLRGYCSLAYILDDQEMKDEAKVWFDAVFANLKADGFLGPRNYEGDNPELWAQMIMLWALQTYYEYSGDERVITAMTNYLKWELTVDDSKFLKGVWQEKRGGDNLWSAIWLYNRTGDREILPLMEKLHQNTSDWTQEGTLPNWHGVNVAQGFREPATYYIYDGNPELLEATYNDFNIMRERFGQVPGGMYGADENARQGYFDPRQGAETCAIVEQMASDEILMGITGDPFWADHCEDVALNTFTAALMPDMKSLRYITSPNMAISDEKLHGPSIDNNLRGMLSMSPFSSRCCQHNHGMGWPYYAEHLVMATTDNGLAAMLYAASETTAKVANGTEVVLEETTEYPFEDKVTFTLHTQQPVTFPLYLRVPAWAKGAAVSINGEAAPVPAAEGKYIRVEHTWSDGDIVELNLPMEIWTRVWQQNKASVSVNYGPLTLSLQINEDIEEHDSRDTDFVQDDSHWQDGVDASLWPCYVLTPQSEWNYALKVDKDFQPVNLSITKKAWPNDNMPFTADNVPLEFSAYGVQIPSWGYDTTGMTDQLPTKYVRKSETETPLKLIPMGAARLRISAFPKIVAE
ncbi:MAG: beta-L-arabinofuranosidase domain-containing protein [Prevotella sp.]